MSTRFTLALALLLACAPMAREAAAQAPAAKTFTPLLNGKDLTGWNPGEGWSVADGALVHTGSAASSMTTATALGDIELQGEFLIEEGAQTSVLLRSASLLTLKVKPGAWHKVSVLQVGERTTVSIEGMTQLVHQRLPNIKRDAAPLPLTGPLMLSAMGTARWRNVGVREISSEEAAAILARHNGEGFTPIFNGRDFDGWAGPIDQYQVVDGAIMCKPERGGTIYTTKQYGDFMVRLEFKLPPGGNNGLAIRYPGKGDAAYLGMTELQVLDNTSEKYAKLDTRQFHGSAYGMVAAHKGYLRPVGEWNFQEVTVRGSTIIVELNGTRILDADLSTVTSFMADSPHPGKDRTSGHFGFAGHGDPVQYRNVSIKPL